MADKPEARDESDPAVIDVEWLGRMSDCLLLMGRSFAEMARFLKEHKVAVIEGEGQKTAERGLNYLSNFSSNVFGGYHNARLNGSLSEDAPLPVQGRLVSAQALAKNISRKKKGGTKDGTGKS